MKNIIYTILFMASLHVGCKKDDASSPLRNKETREVTFSVSKFGHTVEPFDKSQAAVSAIGDTLGNYAKYLYCYVGSGNGFGPNVMHMQTIDSANFGTMKIRLTTGYHTVSFFASSQPLTFERGIRYDQTQFYRGEGTHWYDLFVKRPYTVTVTDTTRQVSVRLERWTGAVQVNLEDAIPTNAAKISFHVANDVTGYSFYSNEYYHGSSTKDFVLSDAQKGQVNQKFLMHVMYRDYSYPLILTLRCYDQQNNLIAEKRLPEFRATASSLVQFTGRLFSTAPAAATFRVTVDPTWDPDSPNVAF